MSFVPMSGGGIGFSSATYLGVYTRSTNIPVTKGKWYAFCGFLNTSNNPPTYSNLANSITIRSITPTTSTQSYIAGTTIGQATGSTVTFTKNNALQIGVWELS